MNKLQKRKKNHWCLYFLLSSMGFLIQAYLLCTVVFAGPGFKQLKIKVPIETDEIQPYERRDLVEKSLNVARMHGSSFNWLVLWPYLKKLISPEGFLEAVRDKNQTTIYSLVQTIYEQNASKFIFTESIAEYEIVLYIFSQIDKFHQNLIQAQDSVYNESTNQLMKTSEILTRPITMASQKLKLRLKILIEKIDADCHEQGSEAEAENSSCSLKEDIMLLSNKIAIFLPDIKDDEGMQNVLLANCFDRYQYIYSHLELPFPDPKKFRRCEEKYVDFTKHIDSRSCSQNWLPSSLYLLSMALCFNFAEVTDDSCMHDKPLVNVFNDFFTKKWNRLEQKERDLKKDMALLVLEHAFLVNPLLPNPKVPASKPIQCINGTTETTKKRALYTQLEAATTVTNENIRLIFKVLLNISDEWQDLAKQISLPDSRISEIDKNHNCNERKLATLLRVTNNNSEHGTLKCYVIALNNMGYSCLISELKEAFHSVDPIQVEF